MGTSTKQLKFWLAIALAFGVTMYLVDQAFLANVAFLVAGALVATVTQLVAEAGRREERERDLAGSLYEELANRVARCVFDFEAPWERFMEKGRISDREMDILRLRKFMPVEPVIYPAAAGQIAVIRGKGPQAVIRFYSHFAILRNDIETVARYCERNQLDYARPDHVAFLADRFHRTLLPGLQALRELSTLVPRSEAIDAEAIGSLDALVPGHPRTHLTLRQRLAHYCVE